MHSSGFFWIRLIARLILKLEIFGSHMISDQSLLLSTIVLNDKVNYCNKMCSNSLVYIKAFDHYNHAGCFCLEYSTPFVGEFKEMECIGSIAVYVSS